MAGIDDNVIDVSNLNKYVNMKSSEAFSGSIGALSKPNIDENGPGLNAEKVNNMFSNENMDINMTSKKKSLPMSTHDTHMKSPEFNNPTKSRASSPLKSPYNPQGQSTAKFVPNDQTPLVKETPSNESFNDRSLRNEDTPDEQNRVVTDAQIPAEKFINIENGKSPDDE